MADVLSQDEITALIESYSATGGQSDSPSAQDKQVRLYDFARPDKFSKEHLRTLNIIHSKHGASFAAALATMLRSVTQVEVLALDQLTYREYCASVPEGTLFAEVALEPLTSTAIFEFNPSFVSVCVDMLAGARVVTASQPTEISEVDRSIMRPIVELSLKKYVESWASCIELTPRITSLMTESNTRQILLPSEAVLVCGYEVTVGGSVSMLSVCIPASSVESVLPALAMGRTMSSSHRRLDEADETLRRNFERVTVGCHAFLGRATLSLSDIMDLEIGDLIKLSTKADAEVELCVESVPAFSGRLGVSGRSLAIQVTRPLVNSGSASPHEMSREGF